MSESILNEGTRAYVTDDGERRIVGSDEHVMVTAIDSLTVLEHVPDFGEYRMEFGDKEIWVDDEELRAGMPPGTHCQLIGDYKVRHVAPCSDGHATGVVTDVRTGEIVERP